MIIEAPRIKKAFLAKIETLLGSNGYSTKTIDRFNYTRDSNFRSTIKAYYNKTEAAPDLIVWPKNTEQVQKLVKLAIRHRVPIVPFGGGSGVSGGTIAVKGGMIIDMKRMHRILKLDTKNLLVTAQAGMLGKILEDELQRQGYTLGHFPSSILCASLGGYLAARSAGQQSSRYGKIEDMVREMEVVTGRGEIVNTRDVSNTSGMDLNQIFVGSEGTLCLFTTATLKIYPLPETQNFQSVRFKNMRTAIEAIRRIMQLGIKPSVVRLYDKLDALLLLSTKSPSRKKRDDLTDILSKLIKYQSLKTALAMPQFLSALVHAVSTGCVVIFVFEGHKRIVKEEERLVMEISKNMGGETLGPDPAKHWMENRYRVSYEASPLFYHGLFTDTIEVAGTWDVLPVLYKEMIKSLSQHALIMAHLSHVYMDGGSFYFTFVAPLTGSKKTEILYDKIWDKAMKLVQKLGGVISHHHGIGRLKMKHMATEWGNGAEIYLKLKHYYDPYGIMNPGKLYSADKKIMEKAA